LNTGSGVSYGVQTRCFRLLCWTMLASLPSVACQCADRGHPTGKTIREIRSSYNTKFDSTAAVFQGIVERQDIRSDSSARFWQTYRLVTVRVTEVFSGRKQEKFELRTGLGGGDCGFDFETGESYLIYAFRNAEGIFYTDMCSHTSQTEYAEPDLRILRGKPPAADDLLDEETYRTKFRAAHMANVCGRVIRSDGRPVSDSVQLVRERHDGFPLPGYPPREWFTQSKPDGAFCFEYVPRGRYFLSAREYDEKTDIQFSGVLSKFWRPLPISVEAGKSVSGLTLVLHRELLFSARKHTLLGSILAAVLVVLIVIWRRASRTSPRREVVMTFVPTGRYEHFAHRLSPCLNE